MDEKQKRAETERQVVEDAIRLTMRLRTMQEGRMNHLLKCEFVSCGVDPYSICLRYPVQEWELNPAGHLHGGASATMAFMGRMFNRQSSERDVGDILIIKEVHPTGA